MSIRPCTPDDFPSIHDIINTAAAAYKHVIPKDCWSEPYMPREELRGDMEQGVEFWGVDFGGELAGVMGIQPVRDVDLIRHAYVRPEYQRQGIGSRLLNHLRKKTTNPVLVGTWAGAEWAIRFYEKHGFQPVDSRKKDILLQIYWNVPDRQRMASVVLAEQRWFNRQESP